MQAYAILLCDFSHLFAYIIFFVPSARPFPFRVGSLRKSSRIVPDIRKFGEIFLLLCSLDDRKPSRQRISVCSPSRRRIFAKGYAKIRYAGERITPKGEHTLSAWPQRLFYHHGIKFRTKNLLKICICAKFVVPLHPQR